MAGKNPHSGPPSSRAAAITDKILDVAEQLAQTRGFNGFSYADIAENLHVTKASLHYHFRSKTDLGRALIIRYHARFLQALEGVDSKGLNTREKLRRYIGLYEGVMQKDRMCLCGMFAAEYATLPPVMQDELRLFFDANDAWLTKVLEQGRRAGEIAFKGKAQARARVFLGALEGAMLVAHSYADISRFRAAAKCLLENLVVEQAKTEPH